LRQAAAEGRDWLADYESQERERTGIPTLRVRYNQVFGFFVQVPRSKAGQVPPEYERRATITHAERFVTPELKAREAEILAAEDRANELEYDLFVHLRRQVAAQTERLQRAARVLAELDVLATLAEVAARYGYTRPVVDESTVMEIKEGRHPVVERLMPEGARFVSNDTLLDGEDQRLLVITGPNMSGKSVYIRQVALVALMAQMGSFVPAASARVGLVDRIFVRAGATDDITQSRSTFLVEMGETAYILRHATSRTLFATHFHELTALADGLAGARNVSLAVKEQGQDVVFLYQLVEGGTDRSYGIQVARLAGVPDHVVERAREMMARLEEHETRSTQHSTRATEERALREISAPYPVKQAQERLLVPTDDEVVWAVVREVFGLDIGNLTPVQALVVLNELQQRLREMRQD